MPQACTHLPDQAADVAGPDDAQRLAPKQRPAQLRLRPVTLAEQAVGEGDLARQGQQQREGELGHRLGPTCPARGRPGSRARRAYVEVDVVEAGAGADDQPQVRRRPTSTRRRAGRRCVGRPPPGRRSASRSSAGGGVDGLAHVVARARRAATVSGSIGLASRIFTRLVGLPVVRGCVSTTSPKTRSSGRSASTTTNAGTTSAQGEVLLPALLKPLGARLRLPQRTAPRPARRGR